MPNIGQQHSIEKSRQLQRNLYLAAKKDKQRRFHALYDRIFRLDILWRAWKEVRENKGSAGIVLFGKLNDVSSGRLFRSDLGFL